MDESFAKFCQQVAAWAPDVFLQLLLTENHKIVKNSTPTKDREKISTYLESLECFRFSDICLTKLKNNQILLNKISHRYLVTTKLFFIGLKILNDFFDITQQMYTSQKIKIAHIKPVIRKKWRHVIRPNENEQNATKPIKTYL
jgi:hypothetical protein